VRAILGAKARAFGIKRAEGGRELVARSGSRSSPGSRYVLADSVRSNIRFEGGFLVLYVGLVASG